MKLKSLLYKKEQNEIIENIISILDLDNEKSITLYELDNNLEKQKKIIDLIPDIRKYFKVKNIIGAKEPEKCKRPYLSIIKHLTKQNYHLYYSDWRLKINNKTIRTKKYVFIKK